MASQDRPNSRIIKTDNYFDGSVLNMIDVFNYELDNDADQKFTELNRRVEIYDHDVINIPTVPAMAIYFIGFTEEYRTIGKTNVTTKMNIRVDIRYYQEILTRTTDYRKSQKALWEISRILRRNGDLNGLSPLGLEIGGGEVTARARWNGIYAGAHISANVPIAIQSRRAIT